MSPAHRTLDEIAQLKEALTKAIKQSNEKVALDILKQLRSITATTELLKTSKIGVFVTETRKHANATETIKTTCKQVVAKWKSDIGQTPSDTPSKTPHSKSTPSSTPSKAGPSIDTKNLRDTSQSSSSSSSVTSPTSAVERTVSGDGFSVKSVHDKVRDKCIEMLYTALATGSDADGKGILEKAQVIERVVHKENDGTSSKYKSRIRSLIANLKDKSNPELKMSVVDGTIPAASFAVMTAEEMMSQEKKEAVERAKKESMHDAVSAAPNQAETDMFKCGRCKQRKCRYYQMQTRSADEPMTTFVTCVNCGNKWKFC